LVALLLGLFLKNLTFYIKKTQVNSMANDFRESDILGQVIFLAIDIRELDLRGIHSAKCY
jgi:hypothetical protein